MTDGSLWLEGQPLTGKGRDGAWLERGRAEVAGAEVNGVFPSR